MTILNNQLTEVAKAMNDESFVTGTHMGFTEDTLSIDVADTSLPGEIGSREALTGTRTDNTLELVALRLSTDVVDTANGDDLKGLGIFSASTSGTMLVENDIVGVLQTTNFDVEFTNTINIIGG